MACFYLEHDVTKVQTVHLCAKLTRAFPGDVLAPLARCCGRGGSRADGMLGDDSERGGPLIAPAMRYGGRGRPGRPQALPASH